MPLAKIFHEPAEVPCLLVNLQTHWRFDQMFIRLALISLECGSRERERKVVATSLVALSNARQVHWKFSWQSDKFTTVYFFVVKFFCSLSWVYFYFNQKCWRETRKVQTLHRWTAFHHWDYQISITRSLGTCERLVECKISILEPLWLL